MSLRNDANRATVGREDSFRNSVPSSGRTAADKLALLMEDAADYRTAREHLRRIVERNPRDAEARRSVGHIDRHLEYLERERVSLLTKTWSA